jgi:hypothetical protein
MNTADYQLRVQHTIQIVIHRLRDGQDLLVSMAALEMSVAWLSGAAVGSKVHRIIEQIDRIPFNSLS